MHDELWTHLESARAAYKKYYNRHVQPPPAFRPRDLVWLKRTNIKSIRPTQKLDSKCLGPFWILETIGQSKLAFCLELPPNLKIHPVFHVHLLDHYNANKIPGRCQLPPPPEEIDGEEEYKVREILGSRIARRRLEYLVDWKGYLEDERTWELVENVSGAADLVAEFHRRYPQCPASKDIPRRSSGA